MKWPDDFTNKVICGDCLEVMKPMPDECVDMVMTSPPYWGLRDYGIGPDQLGLEPNPEMYIQHLTEIFNEAKRVLKKEGTLWLNIGDTYWSAKGSCFNPGGGKDSIETKRREIYPLNRGNKSDIPNLPQKCLTMIPERLAWSLIQNGWILRNKIVWFKPNSMPSSVKDRFSNRWEHVFLFSKSRKYYFDLDSVRESHLYPDHIQRRMRQDAKAEINPFKKGTMEARHRKGLNVPDQLPHGIHRKRHSGYFGADGEYLVNPNGKNPGDIIETPTETRTLGAILGTGKAVKVPGGKGWTGHPPGGEHRIKHDPRWCPPEGKNPGDFFEITTQPFPEAHFAVFPEKLCEKPIKAGCPKQVCKRCGKAKEKIIKAKGGTIGKAWHNHKDDFQRGNRAIKEAKGGHGYHHVFLGYKSCKCNAGFKSGIVLDPFAGAGTVGVVAKKLGRQFILIDIKKEYCGMAKRRIAQVGYQMELRI